MAVVFEGWRAECDAAHTFFMIDGDFVPSGVEFEYECPRLKRPVKATFPKVQWSQITYARPPNTVTLRRVPKAK